MADISVIRVAPELNGQNYGVIVFPPSLAPVFSPPSLQPENLTLLSTQEAYLKVTLVFSDNVILNAPYNIPGNWVFSTSASPITATSVSVSGPVLTIQHTEPTQGSLYTLTIPTGAITVTGRINDIPTSTTFNGVGVNPVLYSAIAADAEHVIVQFSEAVDGTAGPNGAININNYTITPTLNIISAVQISPTKYNLETDSQSPLQIYDLEVQNIKDTNSNEIVTPADIPVQFFGFASASSAVPVIANMTPAPGTSISGSQVIEFDVTDDTGFSVLVITLSVPSKGISEVIHSGTMFGSRYAGVANVRTPISFGYHYELLRDGGWPADITIIPYVVDLEGQIP
jgi:hypothetical protein